MATSYDKVVKLACKPKAAPPKPKYLDPIIAATWSEDGAVHDVCKALSPRLREPNAIIVFKALIVLHTMIRNGATDNVLSYLSQSDVLRLKNISGGHWEGYNAPQNLQHYALYLDARIRAYRDLKHDAIRVQSETNRDMRNSAAIEEQMMIEREHDREKEKHRRFGRNRRSDETRDSMGTTGGSSSLPQRSKTIAGRKLRVMTVEKGLLRETKIVQKMIDTLVECRFYLDDLEDDLNITSLRMLVKDLLILFQACNEGVINVLEHYFEMSKIDAKDALEIYRHFCKETERVVEYLGVAKKLQNLLNVPIPNLRHAPVSLAGALEEYLNDPNFEQNRIEYKTNKEAAERNARNGTKGVAKPADKPPEAQPSDAGAATSSSGSKPPETKAPSSQAMIDFFAAIESEQQSMFSTQGPSPTSAVFQQQAVGNPFQQQMMTGTPFGVPQFPQPVQVQPTGFMMPQQTAANPFGQQPQNAFAQQQQAVFGQQPQQSFSTTGLQPQATGFLVPQATGANPFRQSTLFPQTTGMPSQGPFGMQQPSFQPQSAAPSAATNPFPATSSPFNTTQFNTGTNPFPAAGQIQPQATATNPFPAFGSGGQSAVSATQPNFVSSPNPFPSFSLSTTQSTSNVASPLAQAPTNPNPYAPPRSASVPLTSIPEQPEAVKTHQTGSRNPFGAPVSPPPPVPKAPTLMEIAMGVGNTNSAPAQSSTNSVLTNPTGFASGSIMSNVASTFSSSTNTTSSNPANPTSNANTSLFGTSPGSMSPTATNSAFSTSGFSSLSSQPTGTTSTSSPTSFNPSPLQPQTTGFTGLKPFKPSSSFGAALLESLPPIPQSAPATPDQSKHNPSASLGSGLTLQSTGFGGANNSLGLGFGANPGNTVGVGLRPQTTGMAGAANPFRATMFSLSPGPSTSGLPNGMTSAPTGGAFGSGLNPTATGMPGQFNSSLGFGGAFGLSATSPSATTTQLQQQQNGQASLI